MNEVIQADDEVRREKNQVWSELGADENPEIEADLRDLSTREFVRKWVVTKPVSGPAYVESAQVYDIPQLSDAGFDAIVEAAEHDLAQREALSDRLTPEFLAGLEESGNLLLAYVRRRLETRPQDTTPETLSELQQLEDRLIQHQSPEAAPPSKTD